jgi:OmpA-OmpF porin, OOP family
MRFVSFLSLLLSASVVAAQNIQETFRAVNSSYDEQNPVLSPDGQTLFFTIGNHPENVGGKKDPGDIWFSRKEEGKWSTPVHAAVLNDRAYNAVAGYSPDGLTLFLHGHYGTSGSPSKSQGISFSRNQGSGWARPENIQIPYFMNKSGTLCGAISADNSVFVFSAESYGTYGVDDLYVSVRDQGKWTAPKNLGSIINTQFQELSPSLSEDKMTLYFSSNGRKGEGSFDVYSANRLDDSWTNWSVPVNLGPQINSEGRELFYRFYGATGSALYTTTKSSDGYGDVRIYVPNVPLPASDTTIFASIETKPAAEESPIQPEASVVVAAPDKMDSGTREVTVYGKITNAKTGEPIEAKISFEGAAVQPRVLSSGEEGYSVAVPTAPYTIRIEANGFISAMEKLDINALDMRDLEMNFKLQPVELGTMVNLKSVLFAQAKTDILPESYPELDLVVKFLKENPAVRIVLMGHTDGRGVHADNVKLSQQRVNKVKEYLVEKGIEARRVSGKGFGGSKPIASNDTEESRRMNRRVEFVISRTH